MASETILIIDADEDIEQRITTILEAEGYLIFTASSKVLNTEVLEKLSPSLIYINPLAPTAAGLEPCRTIHGIPMLRDVPIVLLAVPKDPGEPRFSAVYGIQGFLKPTFGPDELIQKTETMLGKTRPSQLQEEADTSTEELVKDLEATHDATEADDNLRLTDKEFTDLAPAERRVPPAVTEQWDEEEEVREKRSADKPRRSEWTEGTRKKRSPLFLPAIGAASLLVIAVAGLLVYGRFAPSGKVLPQRSVNAPSPVPSKPPDTRSEPQVPPEKKTQEASPPASPAPPSPPPREPSPPPKPVPQPPGKPSYSVQLGAFKKEVHAQALVKDLLEKGYDAFAKAGVTKDNSPIYRVFVGKFEDRKAAEKRAKEIHAKERLETTLYSE